MSETEKNVIHEMYNRKTFLKIKQCLEIGKVLFSFVNMDNHNDDIDCYMEAEEFGATIMADVKNGVLFRKLAEEKAKGETYPKAVWQSPIGGTKKGPGGKVISRNFSVAPGAQAEVVITAQMYPAEVNATGAFVAVKGSKPLATIRVSCTQNDLRILQYKWSFLEQDYMRKKYTMDAMKSEWNGNTSSAPGTSGGNMQTSNTKPVNAGTQSVNSTPPQNTAPATQTTTPTSQNEGQKSLNLNGNVVMDVELSGEVFSHTNGQKSIIIVKPGTKEKIGMLYVKPEKAGEISLTPASLYKIKAERKGSAYLFLGMM